MIPGLERSPGEGNATHSNFLTWRIARTEVTVYGVAKSQTPERLTLSLILYFACHLLSFESESEATQSCPTLCYPIDCSPLGSSIHGILQARILEWVAISFSRGSSRPRDRTWVSQIVGRHLTV